MKNTLTRILLVSAAVPVLYALIVFLPQFGHGAVVLFIVIFSAGSGGEIARLFSSRGVKSSTPLFSILAALPAVLLWTAFQVFPADSENAPLSFLAGLCLLMILIMAPFAFQKKNTDMTSTLGIAAARAFPLLYPGIFSAAIVLIADYPVHATEAILWYILLVFSNDGAAWAVGMLFGRHRGIVAVSPNKSLEGFFGAFAGSLGAAFLGPILFPGVIHGSPIELFVLGTLVGVAVVVGDLFESALKRSAGIKDSGNTIPGRGGFLDSFDSVCFAAPVFYSAVRLLDLI